MTSFNSTAEHTPGPWTIGVSADHTPAICVPCEQSSGFVVAHINRIPLMRGVGGSMEANAHLIAAAPTMLEALENAGVFFEGSENDGCMTHRMIIEALAAAKGGA